MKEAISSVAEFDLTVPFFGSAATLVGCAAGPGTSLARDAVVLDANTLAAVPFSLSGALVLSR